MDPLLDFKALEEAGLTPRDIDYRRNLIIVLPADGGESFTSVGPTPAEESEGRTTVVLAPTATPLGEYVDCITQALLSVTKWERDPTTGATVILA